jgi:hypothetical protein
VGNTKGLKMKNTKDIMNWSFDDVMELPDSDPRLVEYLKKHIREWTAEKRDDDIESLKDKIVDGMTEGVMSQDFTQLCSMELEKELSAELAKDE